MTDDKKSKEASGVYVVKEQDIERTSGDLAPSSTGVVSSVATSMLEQQRLKQAKKEAAARVSLADEKTKLNVAMVDLADSEIHKNAAIDRMKNMDQEVQKVHEERENEERKFKEQQNNELKEIEMKSLKLDRKIAREKRRLREEEEGV